MITDKERHLAADTAYNLGNLLRLKLKQRGWSLDSIAREISACPEEVRRAWGGTGLVRVRQLMIEVANRE